MEANSQTLISFWGSIIIYLTGGIDNLIITLFVFMIIDYITGILSGIKKKKLSSKKGFIGIAKKILILGIVMVSALVDNLSGGSGVIRNFTIMFYICNEGVSILENGATFNIPFPQKLKLILEEYNKEGDTNDKNTKK